MPLKFELESIDGLDASIGGLYKHDETTGKYFLDVEGVVPKARHDEFRNNNIQLTNEVNSLKDKFKDVDVDKYNELLSMEDKLKKGGDDIDVDTIVSDRVKKVSEGFETEIAGLKQTLSVRDSQIATLVVDSEVNRAASEVGVLPSATTDLVLRAKAVFKVEDGVAVPYNGQEKVYARDGVTPLSVKEWVVGLRKTAPHLFDPNTGGGASGSSRSSGVDPSKMTPQEKISAGLEARG